MAHAATGFGKNQTRRRNEGRSGCGEKSGVACARRSQEEKKKGEGERREGGARWKNRVHLTSACLCSSHAIMSCCCVRSGGHGCCVHPCACQRVAMSCVASHAITIMMSCLCASVFSSHPSVCAQRACQCRQQEKEHTRPKEKRRGCVCEEEKRNSQP